MAKRSIERLQCISSKASLSEATLRRPKRQRTDGFLEKAANYQQQMSTCRFFETHLKKSFIAESDQKSPSKLSIPSSGDILHALGQSTVECSEKHNSYCSTLLREASEKIRIKESFDDMSAGINGMSSTLRMLDQGIETTEFIKSVLSSYAGVPGDMEYMDMKKLHSILR